MRSQEEILEASEKKLGRTLRAKWRLERLLGVGGMAAVFAASRVDGRGSRAEVALKLLHPEIARSPELTLRFKQEANAAAHIKHPGAVLALETDVAEDGCPFLVMELLEGESLLEQLSRTGEILPGNLLRYVDELLDVLTAAHDAGIVHRDIKLDNLFIERSGRLRVLDFGIARVRSSSITVTGQRLGTIAYMPPEQIRGFEVDGRADLFSVGATMFRAIAKRRVHVAPNEAALLLMMSTTPAPALRTIAPQAPKALAAVVDRALAFYARERYPDARVMRADVRAILEGRDPPYASKLEGAPPTGPSSRGSASGAASQVTSNEPAFTEAPTIVPDTAHDATVIAPPISANETNERGPNSALRNDWSVGGQRSKLDRSKRPAWIVPLGVVSLLIVVVLLAVIYARFR